MNMGNQKILVVEDDKDLNKLLVYNLTKEGYKVVNAFDGEEGLSFFDKEKPDLVILDLMMPKLDGLDFCRDIRRHSQVPIIMLTAKGEEMDRVVGLEMGADDYVTKPFSVRELLARVKARLRRSTTQEEKETIIRCGDMEVDLGRYIVLVKGKQVKLSSKEFEFLKCLLLAKGKVLTRDHLLDKVWGYDEAMEIDTRTVDQHIARLRDKLGSEASRVVTVKNVGYRVDLE